MRKKLVGWKLVFPMKGKLWSLVAGTPGCVEYKKNRVTKPKEHCGPLCLFSNEKDARSYSWRLSLELWKALYTPSDETRIWVDRQDKIPVVDWVPKGTVLASSITLKERIML
jgi:hypothetical protein